MIKISQVIPFFHEKYAIKDYSYTWERNDEIQQSAILPVIGKSMAGIGIRF